MARANRLFFGAFLAIAACGGRDAIAPQTPIAVAPAGNAYAMPAPEASASAVVIPDLPPTGAPKEISKARVTTIDTRSPAKGLAIVSSKLPIVYARIVVRAGESSSFLLRDAKGLKAGVAGLTAQLMKEGGAGALTGPQLADKVDALGTELTVEVEPDRATFGLAVTKDKLPQAFELLASVVTKPRFDAQEFGKLKARQLDKVRQSEKGSGTWMARVALDRELYGEAHPYGALHANDETLARIELADVKAFYAKSYVAANMTLVLVGDVDEVAAQKLAQAAFAKVPTTASPALTFPTPSTGKGVRVVLATKADAKQADILIARFGIPRSDPRWPELALAMHALGGGMASRLFVDVREKRSLAYSTYGAAREVANGPTPVIAYAGTQAGGVADSVAALLENLRWIAGERPVREDELAIARQALETGFVYRLETIGSVASLAIDKETLGLPGADVYDYVAQYRRALREVKLDAVRAEAKEVLSPDDVVIAVAGDPSLATTLAKWGAVRVVDPEKGFSTISTLPKTQ
jgi:zinc protease